jgi:hypothetical protein
MLLFPNKMKADVNKSVSYVLFTSEYFSYRKRERKIGNGPFRSYTSKVSFIDKIIPSDISDNGPEYIILGCTLNR